MAFGDQHVDAVAVALDVVVDPLQLDLELVGRHAGHPHHAHAPRLRHLDDDVAAVAERDEWELDVEQVADAGSHGVPPGI